MVLTSIHTQIISLQSLSLIHPPRLELLEKLIWKDLILHLSLSKVNTWQFLEQNTIIILIHAHTGDIQSGEVDQFLQMLPLLLLQLQDYSNKQLLKQLQPILKLSQLLFQRLLLQLEFFHLIMEIVNNQILTLGLKYMILQIKQTHS